MLTFSHVVKRYGIITAVNDLSLEIRKGEIFGLLGPNGAGKTTTVKLAVGLLKPDQGSVNLDGAGSPDRRQVRACMGVAPQSLALYEELTGRENLLFFGRMQGLSGRHLRERTDAVLDLAGLTERQKSRVETYSGGMKRRLNLAVALLHEPRILFLDEPTVGVDPQSRHAIFESILRLREAGTTVVYTTHYMEEAQKLCDRVGIMDAGKLLALDTVPRLLEAHGGSHTLRVEYEDREERIQTREPIRDLEILLKEKRMRHFHLESPDLEGVFLHLTGRTLRDET